MAEVSHCELALSLRPSVPSQIHNILLVDPLATQLHHGVKGNRGLFASHPHLEQILIFLNVAIILEKCRTQSAGKKNNLQTKEKERRAE